MRYQIISIALILSSCFGKKETNTIKEITVDANTVSLTDSQMKNVNIETMKLSKSNISTTLQLNGKIDVPPQNLVSISSSMGGYLRTTKLLEGMHVNKGDVLAVMEDPQFIQLQQDYLMAKSKLHFATIEYKRQKELNQSQASSDKATEQAQAQMQEQQILMNSISEKLKLIHINPSKLTPNNLSKSINIYAPISGFVSKIFVNIGKYINASEVLFQLVNPSDIHLTLKVYEKDMSSLKIGQNLIAYTNAEPNKKYRCRIILISKDFAQDGSTDVHCHFEDYDKNLLPGMYMNAEIELNTTMRNTLPEDAVVSYEGKNFIFIETEKQHYQIYEVHVGESEHGLVEIQNIDALQNKNIVSKGAYTLLMKMKNTAEE